MLKVQCVAIGEGEKIAGGDIDDSPGMTKIESCNRKSWPATVMPEIPRYGCRKVDSERIEAGWAEDTGSDVCCRVRTCNCMTCRAVTGSTFYGNTK